jgi:hypothetical protein
LLALSDNEGHSLSELASKLEKKKPNVIKSLKELSSHEHGDLLDVTNIQPYHLKDYASLAQKIEDQKDEVSKYIYENVYVANNWPTPCSINGSGPIPISFALSVCLCDENLYNEQRFSHIKLSEDAKQLIALREGLAGTEILILNRILIADAYPDEISKGLISLVQRMPCLISERPDVLYLINLDLRTFKYITDNLSYKIRLNRCQIELWTIKLEPLTRQLGDLYEQSYWSDIENLKVDGKYSINDYRTRYEKYKKFLQEFMASNYVVKLVEEYGFDRMIGLVTANKEIDLIEFMEMCRKIGKL